MENEENEDPSEPEWKLVKLGYNRIINSIEKGNLNVSEALNILDRLQNLAPRHSGLAYLRANICMKICDWTNYKNYTSNLNNLIRKDIIKVDLKLDDCLHWDSFIPMISEFTGNECRQLMETLIRLEMSPSSLQDHYESKKEENSPPVTNLPQSTLKIAYMSGNFEDQQLAHLMMNVPAAHDKDSIKVICFNTGKIDSNLNQSELFIRNVIKSGSVVFHNIQKNLTDQSKADRIRKHSCHILTELNGPTIGNQMACLKHSPTPVTMTMLGYPGTSGTKLIDYILVDEIVVPFENKDWVTEKLAYTQNSCYVGCHPFFYPNVKYNIRLIDPQTSSLLVLSSKMVIPLQARTHAVCTAAFEMIIDKKLDFTKRGQKLLNGEFVNETVGVDPEIVDPIVTSYRKYELPEEKFIYGVFSDTLKLNPDNFRAYLEILQNVPDSILWICVNSLPSEKMFRKNLLNTAGPPLQERIYFSDFVKKEENVRRTLLVDLLLDTWPCNGRITTCLDGLWTGTPILTLQGNTWHGRTTSSLLYTLQLPVLITVSVQQFIDRAIWLGLNKNAVPLLRDLINIRKLVGPLYNVKQFTADLEYLYFRMYDRKAKGLPPDHLLHQVGYNDWKNPKDDISLERLKEIVAISCKDKTLVKQHSEETSVSDKTSNSMQPNQPPPSSVESPNVIKEEEENQQFPFDFQEQRPSTSSGKFQTRKAKQSGGPQPYQKVTVPQSNKTETPIGDNLAIPSPKSNLNLPFTFHGYAKGEESHLKYQSYGEEYKRIPIIFNPPSLDNEIETHENQTDYHHGQRVVNLIYLETAVNNVLSSMTSETNMVNMCMGPIQANQFISLLQEYFFEDHLPCVPKTMSDCPNFYRDSKGLLFSNDHQYAFAHSFFNQTGWESQEPEFGIINVQNEKKRKRNVSNMLDMHWNFERRKTKQKCRLCPPYDPINKDECGVACNTLVTTHYKSHHSGEWYKKIVCPKCGKDMTAFTDKIRERHINNHKTTPNCNESYFMTDDFPLQQQQPNFIMNLEETFEKAAERYVAQVPGATNRKFYRAQRMATHTTWLVPACQRIIRHLKQNPAHISGSPYIGYQFKSLLQCHLRTTSPTILPNLVSLSQEERKTFSTLHFKFFNWASMCMMMRAFVTSNDMNELTWHNNYDGITKPVTIPNNAFNLSCKLCGDTLGNVPKNEFNSVLSREHICPEPTDEENQCNFCGFYFQAENDNNEIRVVHSLAHENLLSKSWKEIALKFENNVVKRLPPTTIRLTGNSSTDD